MAGLITLNVFILLVSIFFWVMAAFGLAFADKPLSMWTLADQLGYAAMVLTTIALIPTAFTSFFLSVRAYRKGSQYAPLIAAIPGIFWLLFLPSLLFP